VILTGALFAWGCGTGGGSTGSGGSGGSGGTTSAGTAGTTGGSGTTGSAGSGPGAAGTTGTAGTTGAAGTTVSGSAGSAAGTTGTAGSGTSGGAGGNTGGATAGSGGAGGSATGGRGGSSTGGRGGSGTGGSATGGGGAGTGGGTGGAGTGVTVNLGATRQTIEGFGLNTALSSATPNWDTFYGTGANGLGLSIVRVAMNADTSLSGAVPPASYNAKIIASPWTAPAADKDNNNTQKGGHLKMGSYDAWATKIAAFAKAHNVYAMAAANEPDFASCGMSIGPPCNGDYDTMVFTANEMVNFVKVLGPKLKALSPPVKFIAPEPSEWLHLWSNASATGSTVASHPNSSDPLKCGCFSNDPTTTGCAATCAQGNGYDYGHFLAKDATAWGLIDILGTHEYDTQKAAPWPSDVDGGKRSKTMYQTEVSGVMYWPEQGPSSDINNGIAVAGWIHSALVVGEASAWLHWWYQASGSNDNEGLVLQGSTALTKRCYTLGNYSKFVRPGYVMVDVTGNSNTNLLLSAFTGTDGTVVVAVNKGTSAATVPITIAGGTAPASCTPYVTSSSANLAAGTAVTVTGGTFTASLAGTTVTTFVCK
jgi:O-glycosyl hydrolase